MRMEVCVFKFNGGVLGFILVGNLEMINFGCLVFLFEVMVLKCCVVCFGSGLFESVVFGVKLIGSD